MFTWVLLTLSSSPTLTLVAGGDVTLGFHYEEYVDEQIQKGTPKESILNWGFAKVAPLTSKADIFAVNLECPFTTRGEKIAKNFNFRARPELAQALQFGGVDVVSLANNHLVDYGPVGIEDTIATLKQRNIAYFGAGENLTSARTPAVVDKNGITIAFLGYFFLGIRNIEPPEVMATETSPGVAGHFSDIDFMKKMIAEDIKSAKLKADHVIPFFHWGREGQAEPEPYQIELAHFSVEQGASVVLGSHPHILQGIELYRGVPIYYSLGNFVFGGNWNPRDKRSALAKIVLKKKGVASATVIPMVTDQYPAVPVQPFIAAAEMEREVLTHLAKLSTPLGTTIPQLRGMVDAQQPASE